MSFARIICRIQTRIPICLEKHDTILQMGRFTMRDEGLTIGSGKVLKYKPKIIKMTVAQDEVKPKTDLTTEDSKDNKQIDTSSVVGGGGDTQAKHEVSELIYDMDADEMVTKEEYMKRQ